MKTARILHSVTIATTDPACGTIWCETASAGFTPPSRAGWEGEA